MKKMSWTFFVLGVAMVTALNISNVLAVKQIELGFLHITAGQLVFPVVYVISDIVSEVYGYRASRRLSWMSFAMNLFMTAFFGLAILCPFPQWWGLQEALVSILGNAPRALLASFLAMQVGNWANDIVFQKMKNHHGDKFFSVRAITSSIVGETLDSTIFFTVALIGALPIGQLPSFVLGGVCFKIAYELAVLPITKTIARKIKMVEPDAYEHPVGYSIFG
jgi:uncharacterized integral membrane protein (TIGR00697 family)